MNNVNYCIASIAIQLLLSNPAHCEDVKYLSYISWGDKNPKYIRGFNPLSVHSNEKECHSHAHEFAQLLRAEPSLKHATQEPNCRKIYNYYYGDVIGLLKLFPQKGSQGQGATLLEIKVFESMELCDANKKYYISKIINNDLSYKYLECHKL